MSDETKALATTTPNPMVMAQQALDKGVDPDKLEKLFDLAERWEEKQAARTFDEAMADFQRQAPKIIKTARVAYEAKGGGKVDYAYAPYEDVMDAIGPLLIEVGITPSFDMDMTDTGKCRMTCVLSKGGHSRQSSVTIPIPDNVRINDSQKMRWAMTFAKRCALENALNLVLGKEQAPPQAAAAEMELLTIDQATTINDAIRETKTNMADFLKWAGVATVSDMPRSKYAEAMRLLDAKRSTK